MSLKQIHYKKMSTELIVLVEINVFLLKKNNNSETFH